MAVRPNCSTPRKSRAKTHVADLMSSWVRLVNAARCTLRDLAGGGAAPHWRGAPPTNRGTHRPQGKKNTPAPYSRVTDVHFAIPHSRSLFSTCLDITGPSREPIHNCSSSHGPSCSTDLLRCSNARVPSPSPHALSFASIPWLGRVKQDRRAWNPRRRNVSQVL